MLSLEIHGGVSSSQRPLREGKSTEPMAAARGIRISNATTPATDLHRNRHTHRYGLRTGHRKAEHCDGSTRANSEPGTKCSLRAAEELTTMGPRSRAALGSA
jgi:hypothetical protein